MGYSAKLAGDSTRTKEIQLTVPQTQKLLKWLVNGFFPVFMSAHEIFSQ